MKRIVSLILVSVLIMTVLFSFTGGTVSEKINPTLTVSADNISYRISDSLYGVSFDNQSYMTDGGLLSELVNNNSFEYADAPTAGWKFDGVKYTASTAAKMNENNTQYVQITVDGSGTVENFGYTEIFNNKSFQFNNRKAQIGDMGFKEGETYVFSAFFENIDYNGAISVSLNAQGNTEKQMFNINDCEDWTKVSVEITSEVTADGSLVLTFEGEGSLFMDAVSLVPKSSYSNKNWKYISLRPDLYDAVKGLSPSFIRFYETNTVDEDGNIYGWKSTIGPLETRKQISTTFDDIFYVNSNAMGFYEYLVLCEELGATPVPVLNIASFEDDAKNNDIERALSESEEETTEVTENEEETPEEVTVEPYVKNVLDFIEYAIGDESTEWGKKRIEDGHKKPFELEYIALDDEKIDGGYYERFSEVYNAVNEVYPEIKIITNSGSSLKNENYVSTVQNFDASYKNVIVNEYYGSGKINLYKNVHRYDDYERSAAQVTVDNFASGAGEIGTVITRNNIGSAVENTAFLTGLERNSDFVKMASYKRLASKRNAQTDKVSLMWFDSQNILLTADYYSQMLFANNMGTNYISTDFDMEDKGIYQSVTVDTSNKVIYVKLVNTTNKTHKLNIAVEGFKNVNNPSVQFITENFKSAYNDFDEQLHVAPEENQLTVKDNVIECDVGTYSVNVVRIPYGKNNGKGLYELPEHDIVSPYIHPAAENALPIMLVAIIFITGVVILGVRIHHHKDIRKNDAENEE